MLILSSIISSSYRMLNRLNHFLPCPWEIAVVGISWRFLHIHYALLFWTLSTSYYIHFSTHPKSLYFYVIYFLFVVIFLFWTCLGVLCQLHANIQLSCVMFLFGLGDRRLLIQELRYQDCFLYSFIFSC